MRCMDGEWVRFEAFPDPNCGAGGAGGAGGGDHDCPAVPEGGGSCANENQQCVYGGDVPCGFLNTLICESGEWVHYEGAPGCYPPGAGGAGGGSNAGAGGA